MPANFTLTAHGITVDNITRNASPAMLIEYALRHEEGSALSETGALIAYSGEKTGRSPKDKRIVCSRGVKDDVWWGEVNIQIDEEIFMINRERAIDYLNTCKHLFCVDAYAGWDKQHRIKVRIICARAYHALFMHNMLIRPEASELETFSEPDYVIYNAGAFPANSRTRGMTSKTSVDLHLDNKELVILGTEYAGEMKKGVFTVMNYLMPKKGHLSMHCSSTEDKDTGESSILFGLSGTGKTTLSADPNRLLIGDDEHVWTDEGVFNIEGGCYAKMINISAEAEPDIYQAVRYGAVLENVVFEPTSRVVDYTNVSVTQNTRGSYPIQYIDNAKIPCLTTNPKNVIFLTCDAFGVLPPVSKLTEEQAMYHFVSGYTAKVAGTEMGIDEPEATFSPCFGGPFLVWHPTKYAQLLAERLRKHGANAWLVNTGWSGGAYGTGARMKLSYTRAIIDAIHSGELAKAETVLDPHFGLAVPTACTNVPSELLIPKQTWADKEAYDGTAKKLVGLFEENYKAYTLSKRDNLIMNTKL
jgi:phosphoenolpyruvate carboxykinase (ATP)